MLKKKRVNQKLLLYGNSFTKHKFISRIRTTLFILSKKKHSIKEYLK